MKGAAVAPYSETIFTSSPEETIEAGIRLGKRLTGGEVIAYKGGLGAGKTTFTRGLAMGMGLEDNVSSPTFAIVKMWRMTGQLMAAKARTYISIWNLQYALSASVN